ncbi:uncharacterized protein LOC128987203 [Macrosteles quadrilineatus]|uniref:uncharacterized protein LOC128987203 n=1 Tax=Macrosteles quadrilineatus TaxID=74068 RepID=UPI0023E26062|nr:uncharacterized protein LOC128987203 [Macrosteles quadrilineatus]
MDHIPIIFFVAVFLPETLPALVTTSIQEHYLTNSGGTLSESIRKLYKRQAEDFGPTNDVGNGTQTDVEGSSTIRPDRPGRRRGGGPRRHRGHHGCGPGRGKGPMRPPGNTDVNRGRDIEDLAVKGLVTDQELGVSSHRGYSRRSRERGECRPDRWEGTGNETSTSTPSETSPSVKM